LASTLNASTSSGLISSGDTSGVLQLQTANTTALTVDGSQNIGIGTASPTALTSNKALTINSPTGFGSLLDLKTNETLNLRVFSNASSSGFSLKTATPLVFETNDTERMRILSGGDVGIGIASPTQKLHVNGPILIGNGGATQYLYFDSTNAYVGRNTSTGDLWVNSAGGQAVIFGIGATERARVDASGNLLVGTTTAYAKTTILGSGTTSGGTALSVRDSGANDLFYVRNDGLIVTGARTTSPYNNTTGSAANLNVDAGGTLSRSTSSLKYKKNIADATHGLTDLLKLRSVTYEGKAEADAGKTFGGLIAEEVHDAGLTEFVQYATDGSPDALAYGNMVALCVKAIQELKAINDTQAETINALTARIVALEK